MLSCCNNFCYKVSDSKKKKKSKVSDYSSIHIVLTNYKYTKLLFLNTSINNHLPTNTKKKYNNNNNNNNKLAWIFIFILKLEHSK